MKTLKRMKEEYRQLHEKAYALAFSHYLRKGYVPPEVKKLVKTTRSLGLAINKYNPNQPRIPAGNAGGGRWTDGDRSETIDSPNTTITTTTGSIETNHPETFLALVTPDNEEKLPAHHTISDKGVHFIKDWEKLLYEVELDAANYPTIGYGHRLKRGESFPNGITKEDALSLLEKDLRDTEKGVKRLVKTPLYQNQFDALVSLIFNFGARRFRYTRCLRYINNRNFSLAKVEFLDINKMWDDKAKKYVVSEGLSTRREQEWEMFENGIYDSRH